MSSGRAVLAKEKGVLLSRLKRMERTAMLNRQERDPELDEEIKQVRGHIQEITALETLWTRGDVAAYETGYALYRIKHFAHA